MFKIRNEAVSLYSGIGTVESEDGIFSREQKWAANQASHLSQDALELYAKDRMS